MKNFRTKTPILIFSVIIISCIAKVSSAQPSYLQSSIARENKKANQYPDDASLQLLCKKLSDLTRGKCKSKAEDSGSLNLPTCFANTPKPFIEGNIMTENTFTGQIYYSRNYKTPSFITGSDLKVKITHQPEMSESNQVLEYIANNKSIFKLVNPKDEFILESIKVDIDGNRHINYAQHYQGIRIWGKEMTVHIDKTNNLYLINSIFIPTPQGINIRENISADDALSIAVSDLKLTSTLEILDETKRKMLGYQGPGTQKCIWSDELTGQSKLAWFISIRPDMIQNWYYFIDATTGEILEKYNNSPSDGPKTAIAMDLSGASRTINTYLYKEHYYLWDATRPMYRGTIPDAEGIIITYTNNYGDLRKEWSPSPASSLDNSWKDPASVSSHHYTGLIYDYYRTVHNRNSIDDKGMDMITVLHVTEDGNPMDDAFWNGKFVTLGDGDKKCTAYSGSLDVIAHEFTHGVISNTVELVYKNQSGALNEALADWGGAMLDRSNWTLGESIALKSYHPSGCIRNMADPHNGGSPGDLREWLPAHMDEYMDMPMDQDNGGVHFNCGIINKATYLIGTSISREKLEKIYYRVLNNKYINKEAKFIDMRLACVKAAQELFGNNSIEVNAVKKAFDDVGITDGMGTQPDPDKPKIEGEEWIAVISASDLSMYKIRPVINNPNTDIVHLSYKQVYTGNGGGAITIPDNGEFILFIDADNNIRIVDSDGNTEELISTNGNWTSISISPNGKYLAATALNDIKSQIYLFDLEKSTYVTVDIYVPSTSTGSIYNEPLAVGQLSWNISGNYLIYDVQNYELGIDGSELIYWDVNMIDIQNGNIFRVFPPQRSGVMIGNPSFSKNSEYLFVFDSYDNNTKLGAVKAANLYSGEIGTIFSYDGETSRASMGSYSIDDNKMAFQYVDYDKFITSIATVNLDSKKINSSGQAQIIANFTALPKWFAIGSRPLSVSRDVLDMKAGVVISPNPASTECIISLDASNKILKLAVFDLNGSEVADLTDRIAKSGGLNIFTWKCLDNRGNKISRGCYYIKILSINNFGQMITETNKLIISD